MKRLLDAVLYVLLLAVVVSCLRSVWIGLFDVARYRAAFPGAVGVLYPATLIASFGAAVTAVFIAFRKRAAVLANPFVGFASILLLEFAHGPRINQLVVLTTTTLTTVIPWYLWFIGSRSNEGAT